MDVTVAVYSKGVWGEQRSVMKFLLLESEKNATFFKGCRFCSKKKVREKSRSCHNYKPQPFPDPKRKRKLTNQTSTNHHTKRTKACISIKWQLLSHPSYSQDHGPSNFICFQNWIKAFWIQLWDQYGFVFTCKSVPQQYVHREYE